MASKYLFDRWFGNRNFVLVKGTDYGCSQMTMAQTIRNAASKRGLRVSIREVPEGLAVEVVNFKEPLAAVGGVR